MTINGDITTETAGDKSCTEDVELLQPRQDVRTRVLFVLAFTGVPQMQLRPEQGASSGRWDEVFRSLLAVKCREQFTRHLHVACNAVVLVEVHDSLAPNRAHCGVAPVLIDAARLGMLQCGEEEAAVALFGAWAAAAPALPDCCTALDYAVGAMYGATFLPSRGEVHVFASAEEMPDSSSAVFVPTDLHPTSDDAATASDFIAKIIGSPVGWALEMERSRIPLLVATLMRRGVMVPLLVSLGAARLRASQVVICDDRLLPATTTTTKLLPSSGGRLSANCIPPVAFRIHLGRQTAHTAAVCAQHFLVEVMWLEKRRDTPHHHVAFLWTDVGDGGTEGEEKTEKRCANISSAALGKLRGEMKRGGLGGAPAVSSCLERLPQLMAAGGEPASRRIRLALQAVCMERGHLEQLTMRVGLWQLRCLCRAAGSEIPLLGVL